jgi:hypothetical protein
MLKSNSPTQPHETLRQVQGIQQLVCLHPRCSQILTQRTCVNHVSKAANVRAYFSVQYISNTRLKEVTCALLQI